MTVMGRGDDEDHCAGKESLHAALIAVKEKDNGLYKTIGTGCAIRTNTGRSAELFGQERFAKKYHLLISSGVVSKDTLTSRENKGKYFAEFKNGKPRIELEKASNTLFKYEAHDFHLIAVGRGRTSQLGEDRSLSISESPRERVIRGEILLCFFVEVANENPGGHEFKCHEILYDAQKDRFHSKVAFSETQFPLGAPVLNADEEVVAIVSRVGSNRRKVELCFVNDERRSRGKAQPPPVTPASDVTPTESKEVSKVEERPPEPKPNGELKPPEKPQRSTKINRSQSERSPNHLGTGKNRDLRHSLRYTNRNGYRVYVAGEQKESGVQRWRPKGFGAKKSLFEGREPVKFLGARHITSPVAKARQTKMVFNKPRPKIMSSVSLPCKLNETGKTSRSFTGLQQSRAASTSNIPAGYYFIKDLPSAIKSKAADFLDDPAKGQLWRKIAIHYGITEVEVHDLAFGASRHISGSETKALFQKLSVKNPNLTVLDLVDYLLSEHASREILNMFLFHTYKAV